MCVCVHAHALSACVASSPRASFHRFSGQARLLSSVQEIPRLQRLGMRLHCAAHDCTATAQRTQRPPLTGLSTWESLGDNSEISEISEFRLRLLGLCRRLDSASKGLVEPGLRLWKSLNIEQIRPQLLSKRPPPPPSHLRRRNRCCL